MIEYVHTRTSHIKKHTLHDYQQSLFLVTKHLIQSHGEACQSGVERFGCFWAHDAQRAQRAPRSNSHAGKAGNYHFGREGLWGRPAHVLELLVTTWSCVYKRSLSRCDLGASLPSQTLQVTKSRPKHRMQMECSNRQLNSCLWMQVARLCGFVAIVARRNCYLFTLRAASAGSFNRRAFWSLTSALCAGSYAWRLVTCSLIPF